MVKAREFKEYTATVKDLDGDEHESTVTAAVETEDTVSVINTRTGSQQTFPGDVLVQTDRPDVFDVLAEKVWTQTGYGGEEPTAPESQAEQSTGGTDKTTTSPRLKANAVSDAAAADRAAGK